MRIKKTKTSPVLYAAALLAFCLTAPLHAQPGFGPPQFGGGGPGGRGFGGPGGMGQKRPILKQFDKDGDGYLNAEERKAAREAMGGQGGFRGRGRGGPGNQEAPKPNSKLTPAEAKSYPDEPLFSMQVVRTLFLEFEEADWEKELEDFYHTDVDVPATLTVDGKTYRDVGVHFRGNTSYMMVSEGRKRSLSISVDFLHKEQALYGYHGFNLLNSAQDPTFMRSALYNEMARDYIPAPKSNWVRLAINGEDWGIYVNVQEFNKDFLRDWYGTTKGARWKIPGSPGGRGGFAYLGDDPAAYKTIYDIRSKDDPKAWADLIRLCKVLNSTPADRLEKALEPLLDVDATLKFLALDIAAVNNDGYWTRASDVGVYEDEQGRFHIAAHDANETFEEAEQMGRGGGGSGVAIDPFAGTRDPNHALTARLRAVPALRSRYLT